MESNTVGKTPLVGEQWSCGILYVVLPIDIDREAYINDCLMNLRVSAIAEDGAFFNRVPIDEDILNRITFPLKPKELGSALVYVTEPIHKQPIIVAKLNKRDELSDLKENQFKLLRKLEGRSVEITGSSRSNSLNLIVNSLDAKGLINIILANKTKNSKFSIQVDGDIQMLASKTTINQEERFLIETSDGENKASYEQTSTEHSFLGKKIIINEGEEPAVLGNKLVSFVENLIDTMIGFTVMSPQGPLPLNPVDIAKLQTYKQQAKDVLSSEFYLSK
jgi:hypothetical protein